MKRHSELREDYELAALNAIRYQGSAMHLKTLMERIENADKRALFANRVNDYLMKYEIAVATAKDLFNLLPQQIQMEILMERLSEEE